ncbi:hypothetical protein, partial [Micromonospora sp. NPDC048830]|uniref:hypothetical protein n=1 Tax=Micromonospora sp. NPDC048830 TaxID=3364257 RepID=UPI00371B2BFE
SGTVDQVRSELGIQGLAPEENPPDLSVGIVNYMLLVYVDVYVSQGIFTDFPMSDQVDRTYLRIPVETLAGRALFWAALGGALIAWTMRSGRHAYSLLLLAGFACSAVLLTAGARTEAVGEYEAVCIESQPRVCVDRAHDHLGTEYQRRIRENLAALRGIDMSSVTFVPAPDLFELSRRYSGSMPSAQRILTVPLIDGRTSPAHRIGGASFDASFGFSVFLAPCLQGDGPTAGQPTGSHGTRAAFVLYDWWLGVRDLARDGTNFPGELKVQSILAEDPGMSKASEAFAQMDEGRREEFLRSHQADLANCRGSLPT